MFASKTHQAVSDEPVGKTVVDDAAFHRFAAGHAVSAEPAIHALEEIEIAATPDFAERLTLARDHRHWRIAV
jgi:hypothetical protein